MNKLHWIEAGRVTEGGNVTHTMWRKHLDGEPLDIFVCHRDEPHEGSGGYPSAHGAFEAKFGTSYVVLSPRQRQLVLD